MNTHFDFLAPLYDRLIRFTRLESLLQRLALPYPGHLLDAGGGTGRVAAALRPYVNTVVVADVSPGMLAQARQKNLIAARAASEHLPFPAHSFDRILMVDALHHVVHQEQTILELYRVLKPGGRLVIEEPDLNTLPVKAIALFEKIMLMRSHFLPPEHIARLFPSGSQVTVERQDYIAWIIVEKGATL